MNESELLYARLSGFSVDVNLLQNHYQQVVAATPVVQYKHGGSNYEGWAITSRDGSVDDGVRRIQRTKANSSVVREATVETPLCTGPLKSSLDEIKSLGINHFRARIMRLRNEGDSMNFHRDADKPSWRLHIPILTNPNSFFQWRLSDGSIKSVNLPADGSAWLVRVDTTHRAVNTSDLPSERVHLLMSLNGRPKSELFHTENLDWHEVGETFTNSHEHKLAATPLTESLEGAQPRKYGHANANNSRTSEAEGDLGEIRRPTGMTPDHNAVRPEFSASPWFGDPTSTVFSVSSHLNAPSDSDESEILETEVDAEARPVVMNDPQQVDWATLQVVKRDDLLHLLPHDGVVCEVGVFRGNFATKIIDLCAPKKLHLVDPWVHQDLPLWEKRDTDFHFDNMRQVQEKFEKHIAQRQVVLHQGFAADILSLFPESYLDWAYLDGDHRYESVRLELELCDSRVKKDGFILGHDFIKPEIYPEGRRARFQVVQAVRDFCATRAWKLVFQTPDQPIGSKQCPTFVLQRTFE